MFTRYFSYDKRRDFVCDDNQIDGIMPWYIESIDVTPSGDNPFEIEREIVIIARPFK
jgi:hypothetical protein